jgi:hypothetical protein
LLPKAEVTFGGDIRVENVETLICTATVSRRRSLQYLDRPKPWERSGWLRLASTEYVGADATASVWGRCSPPAGSPPGAPMAPTESARRVDAPSSRGRKPDAHPNALQAYDAAPRAATSLTSILRLRRVSWERSSLGLNQSVRSRRSSRAGFRLRRGARSRRASHLRSSPTASTTDVLLAGSVAVATRVARRLHTRSSTGRDRVLRLRV